MYFFVTLWPGELIMFGWRRKIGWLAVAGASFLVLGLVASGDSPVYASVIDAAFFEPEKPCVGCDSCELPIGLGHATFDSPQGQRKPGPNGAHPDRCDPNSCVDDHPPGGCTSSLANAPSVSSVWLAARAADADGVQTLLDANPNYVVYNATRAALQVIGCEGVVLAHIPLRRGQELGLHNTHTQETE